MKKLYFLLLVLLIFVSCTSNTIYKKPKDLIPKDTMIMLLEDLFIASSTRSIKNKFLQKNIEYSYLVYEKYKIDSTRFQKSNFYYTTNIEEYNEMLKRVEDNLKAKRDLYVQKNKEIDSISLLELKKTDFNPVLDKEKQPQ